MVPEPGVVVDLLQLTLGGSARVVEHRQPDVRQQSHAPEPSRAFESMLLRWSLVVGQVEVGHAEVERAAQDGALNLQRTVITEVLPQPQGDLGQVDATAPAAAIGHLLVPVIGGDVGHGQESVTPAVGGPGWRAASPVVVTLPRCDGAAGRNVPGGTR